MEHIGVKEDSFKRIVISEEIVAGIANNTFLDVDYVVVGIEDKYPEGVVKILAYLNNSKVYEKFFPSSSKYEIERRES